MRAPEEARSFRSKQQYVYVCIYEYVFICTCIHILSVYLFYMYIHTERYPHMIVSCHTCYFSAWSCQMLCTYTRTSTHALQTSWTVLSLQCFTQAEKSSFFTCVAESEFFPVRRKYLWYFCPWEESGVSPSFFLPSPLSKPGACSNRGHGKNEFWSRWCPSLSRCNI